MPRCSVTIPITRLARGTQIPIDPTARHHVPIPAVSSLGGFRTPAAEYAVPYLMRPASEILHITRHRPAARTLSACGLCTPAGGRLCQLCPFHSEPAPELSVACLFRFRGLALAVFCFPVAPVGVKLAHDSLSDHGLAPFPIQVGALSVSQPPTPTDRASAGDAGTITP